MRAEAEMLFVRVALVITAGAVVQSIELKGLQILVNLLSGELLESKAKEEEDSLATSAISKGVSSYSFINYVSHKDRAVCDLNDSELRYGISDKQEGKKPAIKVKCLPKQGNGTVQIVSSVKEVVSLLAPHGNNTKRNVEGNCALVLFYTRSCPGSAMVAPHFNALARQFPDIKVAAIDAFKFHSFNTEFGIVGLPTIMLFHQGRPIVKFNDSTSTVNNFVKFVGRHTDIKPVASSAYVTSDDFNGPLSNKIEKEPDKYLYLAWTFIILCAGYYFTKSALYVQIVEMIKRNWRESEAQHEGG